MDPRIREWEGCDYFDPVLVLRSLRAVELGMVARPADFTGVPERVRRLRVNDLKGIREARDAAIFSHGMATFLGTKVLYAPVEAADFDFVTMCSVDDMQFFVPVQLKEVPPAELAPRASLQTILDGLGKYPESDTALAINFNRREQLDLKSITIPQVPFRELWIFACTAPDHSSWILAGDFRAEPRWVEFSYPDP
jgi:hypothetical protein